LEADKLKGRPNFRIGPRAAAGKKGIILVKQVGHPNAQIFIINADGSDAPPGPKARTESPARGALWR